MKKFLALVIIALSDVVGAFENGNMGDLKKSNHKNPHAVKNAASQGSNKLKRKAQNDVVSPEKGKNGKKPVKKNRNLK
jgi:hypothetical protein